MMFGFLLSSGHTFPGTFKTRKIVFESKLTFNLIKQADNWLIPNAKAAEINSFCVQHHFIS